MKTLNRTYANNRLHNQLKGRNSNIVVRGDFGRLELAYVGHKYRLVAVNKETKQHFVKTYATLAGAMVAFDTLKEYWI